MTIASEQQTLGERGGVEQLAPRAHALRGHALHLGPVEHDGTGQRAAAQRHDGHATDGAAIDSHPVRGRGGTGEGATVGYASHEGRQPARLKVCVASSRDAARRSTSGATTCRAPPH